VSDRAVPTAPRWPRWNVRVAAGFGAVLILTGASGLVTPDAGLMSQAVPYDVFHIGFGVLGLSLGLRRRAGPCALFNLGFGAVDLYQVVAGLTGVFPAHLFALRPADHAVHLVLGALLVAVGWAGLRRR
jgi:hypothetical protein